MLCPFFDDIYALREFQFTTPCLLRIALSCIFAIGVNVSNYLVIGKTSPLTYQVLGHLKTVLIIVRYVNDVVVCLEGYISVL